MPNHTFTFMKKIYLLSLLCLLGFAGFAQTTLTLYPVGGTGTYSTGSCDGTTRTDDIMSTSTLPAQYCYAVYDVSGIPAGAQITSVRLGYYISVYGGFGTPSGCNTFGYAGDLSAISTPSTLFTAMVSGPILASSDYGYATGDPGPIASNPTMVGFVQTNYSGGKLSITFTGGGARTYTFSGESKVHSTAPASPHAPYLEITYCSAPTFTAPGNPTATPNPICEASTLNLNSNATFTGGGSLTYQWDGPNTFTSVAANPTLTAVAASAGVYSLTVTHVCGVNTVSVSGTTASVTVNPVPAAITGATAICSTGAGLTSTTLSDATPLGTWKSSNTSIATISGLGVVNAVTSGAVTISYILSATGCYTVSPMAVNVQPTAITGGTNICESLVLSLTESVGGGAWSSSNTSVATVVAPGDVTGVTSGSATITYAQAGCNSVYKSVTVDATPPAITGGPNVCTGFGLNASTFSDALGGGTWTSSNTYAAVFGTPPIAPPNKLYGVMVGSTTITYTTAAGCSTSLVVNVDTSVLPITGPNKVCQYQNITLVDASTGTGSLPPTTWSSSNTSIATVGLYSGIVTGAAAGTARITYHYGACLDTQVVRVNAAPAAITGVPAFICASDSFFLSDPSPGGKWTSGNTAYATVDSNTGKVKTLTSGLVDITYTFTGSGCPVSANLNINPSPSGVVTPSGPTTFCTGGNVTLSVPSGAVSYQWYTGSSPMSGATTSSYYTDSTQSVSIQIVNAAGCTTTTAPIVVIAGISPTVDFTSGTDTFCQGGVAVLTANPHSAVGIITYQWMFNGLSITGATAPSYAATKGGAYMCVVSVSGGSGTCVVPTSLISLKVNTAPVPPIAYAGKMLTTSNTYQGYLWFLNTKSISGATSSSYVPKQPGSYRVLVTDTNGCQGYSTAIEIKAVSVAQVSKDDIRIFPNPATSVLHIESPVAVRATITSVEGKVLISEVNAHDLNIKDLPNGLYLLMLYDQSGERIAIEKVIKE